MQTYSDEYLDHWGDVYVRECVSLWNIPFEAFLYRPEAWLAAIEIDGHAPLSAAQSLVRDRLMARELEADAIESAQERELRQIPGMQIRQGAFLETLHHSRYSRNGNRARIGRVI